VTGVQTCALPIWYGSPQWQIEAFRRIEIPEEMGKKWGFAPLGRADGPVKTAIFGGNARRLYNLPATAERPVDQVTLLKERYGNGEGGRLATL